MKFAVTLNEGLDEIRRCSCSLCHKKAVIMASVPCENFEITEGTESLTRYQWNTHIARHYFCKVCGIYTHHQRRSAPHEYAFNVACLEDASLTAGLEVQVVDGAAMSVVGEENG